MLGLVATLGVLLALHPAGLVAWLPVPQGAEIAVGLGLLAALGALHAWLASGRTALTVRRWRVALPPARLSIGLTALGVADLLTAAVGLWVLMPADAAGGFPFFVVYVFAVSLGALSHAPGGIGVFEASMIAGLGEAGRSDVLAALLVHRLVLIVLPFVLATLALTAGSLRARRAGVADTSGAAYRLAQPPVPLAASGIALLSGAVLLGSGAQPGEGGRLAILRDVLPLPMVETSHPVGSVVGVLLIVVARGLHRRLARAWAVSVGLLSAGLVASLAKGLDWEEAGVLSVVIGALAAFRGAFCRTAPGSVFRPTWAWIVPVLALVFALVWIGFLAYFDVAYRDSLWWEFAWRGDASRFLCATLAVAVVLAAVIADALIAGRGGRGGGLPPEPIPGAVRAIVAASPDSEANIALTGGKRFLVSEDGRAFLSHADSGHTLITKGDPIGDPKAGRALLWSPREMADAMGRRVACHAVSTAYLPSDPDLGLTVVKIGEVARMDLARFGLEGPRGKPWRYATSRVRRDGLAFEIVPAAELARHLPELREVSDAWLASTHGEEKGFALGSFDPAYLSQFDRAVMRETATGAIVAFANLMPSGQRHELTLDLMRHRPGASRAVMDALFVEIMLWGHAQGFRWFALGAAPLAGIERRRLAPLWSRIAGHVYEHGDALFGFKGLRIAKQKFDPVWTPNYLTCAGGLDVPRTLNEVNTLISGGVRGLLARG